MLEKETVDKEARINDDNKDVITEEEYQNASGPVAVGLTNDYMFRVVFQQNKHALKGLIASVLHIRPESIRDLEIKNAIQPGVSITDKEYRMDILATMNDGTSTNLEMQLRNLGNWKYRSLSYLCRNFDSLDHGDDYDKVQPTYQIGFLGFTLFNDHPEFCATYQMRNAKDNFLYTGRFNLIVVELNHEKLATEEDRLFGIDKWVKLFKSTTWEELRMIAQDDEYLTSAVKSMYLSNEDYNVIKVARERDDFLRSQAYKDRRLAEQADEIIKQANEIETLNGMNAELNDKNAELNDKNAELNDKNAELNSENARLSDENMLLRQKLKEYGIK